jgi:hypothetical protein
MKTKLYPYFHVLRHALVKLYTPIFLFLFVVLLINLVGDIPFSRLTRDPISLAGFNPLFGIVSNVGVLLWCVATTVSFFAAAMLTQEKDSQVAKFLFASGMFSFFLMIDDFFVIHESLRDYFGIPENIVYVFYFIYVIFYFTAFRKLILNRYTVLLILAFGFLGASATLDIFQKLIRYEIPGYFFVEDGLKLIGIASWAGYFLATAFTHIKQSFSTEMTTTVGDG